VVAALVTIPPVKTGREIDAVVVEVTARHLRREPSRVRLDASFLDDLGADSLALGEIVMELEERLGVTVPDEALAGLTTVAGLADYVRGRL
jgi:acyl carrier protein